MNTIIHALLSITVLMIRSLLALFIGGVVAVILFLLVFIVLALFLSDNTAGEIAFAVGSLGGLFVLVVYFFMLGPISSSLQKWLES